VRSKPARLALYTTLVVMFLLHNDFWLWSDGRIVVGLPVGLLYHIVYAVVTSVLMFLIVRFAWPYLAERGDSGS
jgi:hypothetical protein